jgi:hypothetical protein
MEPEVWRCHTCGRCWSITVRAVPRQPGDTQKFVSCPCGQPFFLVGERDVVTREPAHPGLAWGFASWPR